MDRQEMRAFCEKLLSDFPIIYKYMKTVHSDLDDFDLYAELFNFGRIQISGIEEPDQGDYIDMSQAQGYAMEEPLAGAFIAYVLGGASGLRESIGGEDYGRFFRIHAVAKDLVDKMFHSSHPKVTIESS